MATDLGVGEEAQPQAIVIPIEHRREMLVREPNSCRQRCASQRRDHFPCRQSAQNRIRSLITNPPAQAPLRQDVFTNDAALIPWLSDPALSVVGRILVRIMRTRAGREIMAKILKAFAYGVSHSGQRKGDIQRI